MLKYIFFDLDDTILNFTAGEANALSQALSEAGIIPTQAVLDRYHVINQACWELLEEGRLTRDEVLVQRFEQLFREMNIHYSGRDLCQRYEYLLSKQHAFMPDAEQLLRELSSKYRLYLASNGAAAVQNPRLDVPTSGEYFLNGTDVSTMEDNELSEVRNREIGFIFQGFNLISNLTAIENVELPLVYRGVDRKTRHKLAVESLTMVGLEKRMDHRPNEMSGGQQQRVAIARAIAAQPPVILADEPTGNLDSASSKEILQILKSMHEQGKTVILITHDNGIAAQARRVVRIMDGKIESDFINKNYGKEEYIKNQLDA